MATPSPGSTSRPRAKPLKGNGQESDPRKFQGGPGIPARETGGCSSRSGAAILRQLGQVSGRDLERLGRARSSVLLSLPAVAPTDR